MNQIKNEIKKYIYYQKNIYNKNNIFQKIKLIKKSIYKLYNP